MVGCSLLSLLGDGYESSFAVPGGQAARCPAFLQEGRQNQAGEHPPHGDAGWLADVGRPVPCVSPLVAFRNDAGDVVFNERRNQGGSAATLELPCGRCIGCRLERSRQWAVRCMHEASCWDVNCFVTFTYDDEHLPADRSLCYRHFQDFMRRLRRWAGHKVRFFMSGEYGEATSRPHYHAILFGVGFPDQVPARGGANPLASSAVLDRLWGHGRCLIGGVSFDSAAYVARYVIKKVTGDLAADHYSWVDDDGVIHRRVPEFCQSSRRPGIGATWFVLNSREVGQTGSVVMNGHECKPPRYYDKLLRRFAPRTVADMKDARAYDAYLRKEDDTPARRAVKQRILEKTTSEKKRSLA